MRHLRRSVPLAATVLFLAWMPVAAQDEPPASEEPPAAEESPATEAQAEESPPSGNGAALERLSRLQGRAYLGRRRNIVGATVVARPAGDAARLYVTSTDEGGVFRIEGLPDGEYELDIEREGLVPVHKGGVELRFPFRAVVELPMQPVPAAAQPVAVPSSAPDGSPANARPIALHGVVREVDQEALHEAQLRLVRADGTADPRMIESAEDGTFAVDSLPAGEWLLTIRAVGMLSIQTRLDFREDTELGVTLVLQPAGYDPSPLELMPPEEPVPPAVFVSGGPAPASAQRVDLARGAE